MSNFLAIVTLAIVHLASRGQHTAIHEAVALISMSASLVTLIAKPKWKRVTLGVVLGCFVFVLLTESDWGGRGIWHIWDMIARGV